MNATRFALVTGATSGIGKSFAEALARDGWAVIVSGRSVESIDAVIAPLSGKGHESLPADLATDDGVATVIARLIDEANPVDLLVHAAGVGTSAPFPDAPIQEEEVMLALNVGSTLRLTHAAAEVMRERSRGSIVLIASTAAYWSTGTYAASKSWVLSMGLGLHAKLASAGVQVLVVVPGFTRTEFHARSGADASGVQPWLWLDSDEVARESLEGLAAGRAVVIPGRRYRALVETVRHLPPGGRAAVLRRLAPLRSLRPN